MIGTSKLRPAVLNLDGSAASQAPCRGLSTAQMESWGPRIRLGCSFGRFAAFERELAAQMGSLGAEPLLTFCGSGDFHHVGLALCRRLTQKVNLLVIDKHPDWMTHIPLLHCGSWLWHAARLANVERVFHVGGELDFDNGFRHLAPWELLRSGKIVVMPGGRRFTRGRWREIEQASVRPAMGERATIERIEGLLEPWREELAARPLYVSLDKDVLQAKDAAVNWDSGVLETQELLDVLSAFGRASEGRCAGVDVFGDWSPCRTQGLVRYALDQTEHPKLKVTAEEAAAINARINRRLMEHLGAD